MLTKFMKWIASTAPLGGLLLPVFMGRYAVGYHVALVILIPAAATVVIFQVASLREYRWVAAFCVGGLPVQPRSAVRVLDSADPGRGHARAYFVRPCP